MASGTIYGSTNNQYIDAKVVWSSVPDKSTNKSAVTAILYYKRNNTGYETSGTGTFSVSINGVIAATSKTITITENSWVKAKEATVAVSHDSNGTKSITISAYGSIPGTTLTSTNLSGTATLDIIPRVATIDSVSCATKYFNGEMTFKYTPKSESHYIRCNVSLNIDGTYIPVKTINIGKKDATQQTYSFTLSENELSIIYNKFPNSTKGTLRFMLGTYVDSGYSKELGADSIDDIRKEITLSIPNIDATQPTATITVSPVNSLASPFNTLYIKGKTKVDVNFTNGEGKYGASVVSYKATVDGKSYGSPYTSEYITKDGSVSVTGTLTDSRGYSRTYSKPVTFISYASPRILPVSGESEIVCARCDASGNITESGTYLKIKAKRSYSKVVSSGSQKNFCKIRYRYKVEGGSYSSWETILADTATSDEVTTGALLGGKLLLTNAYVVQVGVVDTIGESNYTTINIPTDKVYMHRAGSIRSLGIGEYATEDNTVSVAEDITTKFKGKVKFAGEAWLSLGLSENVADSESNCGRWGGTGCYYRVCAGEKHVYVAFNCAFTYANASLQINKDPIPSAYRPKRNVYAICATGGRAIARILVTKEGNVIVDWIQVITTTEATTSSTVKWIDGYIDYWT
jgi:hypothetical protein